MVISGAGAAGRSAGGGGKIYDHNKKTENESAIASNVLFSIKIN